MEELRNLTELLATVGSWQDKETRYLQQEPVWWELDPVRETLRTGLMPLRGKSAAAVRDAT